MLQGTSRAHVLLDSVLEHLWPRFSQELRSMPSVNLLSIRGGERCKSTPTLVKILTWLDQSCAARRSEPLIVIGGGAILDVGSFAASVYRRGIPFWRVPTTLIGLMDAGIGLKTAINFRGRKNLVGTFALPDHVIVDPGFLATLPASYTRSGMAEIVKLGLAVDHSLFERLQRNHAEFTQSRFQTQHGRSFFRDVVSAMLGQLQEDPYEERLLNPTDLGHSFSRMFEQHLRPRPLHGEAVALDISLTVSYSRMTGLLSEPEARRIIGLLRSLGLPTARADLSQEVIDRAYRDILRHRDEINEFPLIKSIGTTVNASMEPDVARSLSDAHRSYHRSI